MNSFTTNLLNFKTSFLKKGFLKENRDTDPVYWCEVYGAIDPSVIAGILVTNF